MPRPIPPSGSVAAHACLVAREYGIPAVVATGDATVRLTDGQLVLVDGSRGRIEVVRETPERVASTSGGTSVR